MAFWGIEVKPGKPYTHSSKDGRGRLRISQATLATGSATKTSLVQCNVGDKSPVLLCALLPDKTESLQLDLEFDEAEDVIFSVIGPRGVYLTGYYVGHSRHSIQQDDTESYGEDIANSETRESNQHSDEDEYDDSFINDDEPEPLTPSPVSSSRDDDDDDDDDEQYLKKKKKDVKGGCKRLIKKSQIIESDDDVAVIVTDDGKSSPVSSIQEIDNSDDSGKKIEETANELENETEKNDDENIDTMVLDSKDDINVDIVNDKTEGEMDVPLLAEVVPESKSKSKSKSKKKKRETPKEKMDTVPNENNSLKEENFKQNEENNINVDEKSGVEVVANEGTQQAPINEVKTKKKKTKKGNAVKSEDENQIDDVMVVKDNEKPNNMDSLEMLVSTEVKPEEMKPKRKRKTRGSSSEVLNNQEDDQQTVDNGNHSEKKKVKKKKAKTTKTEKADENTNMETKMEVENENEKEKEDNKKTLSNGLVIEELATGKSRSKKVAVPGKKVKVEYVVKLKENGQVIDSNGESPYKFRLGDKQVIEGLNVGVDGMKVGDKRRLTIPPSMSVGYTGTGENVPPNSWLVYDVEMCGIH